MHSSISIDFIAPVNELSDNTSNIKYLLYTLFRYQKFILLRGGDIHFTNMYIILFRYQTCFLLGEGVSILQTGLSNSIDYLIDGRLIFILKHVKIKRPI